MITNRDVALYQRYILRDWAEVPKDYPFHGHHMATCEYGHAVPLEILEQRPDDEPVCVIKGCEGWMGWVTLQDLIVQPSWPDVAQAITEFYRGARSVG